MSTMLQTRVDDELADAARQRAEDQGLSLSRYLTNLVRRDLAQAEEAAFWQSFTDYYDNPQRVAEAQAEVEQYAGTLTDGLGPDEDTE
jgi:antitoxin component of RelBE/YafQ-DinJ toxin-antitoxin module